MIPDSLLADVETRSRVNLKAAGARRYAANRAKGNLSSADLLKLATRLAAMEIFGAPIR
jgi:hypothetical protein